MRYGILWAFCSCALHLGGCSSEMASPGMPSFEAGGSNIPPQTQIDAGPPPTDSTVRTVVDAVVDEDLSVDAQSVDGGIQDAANLADVEPVPLDADLVDAAPMNVDSAPLEPMPVPPETAAILDDVPGYAQGTRGGRDGVLYVVSTLLNSGPGSLRAGLESEEPLWIIFEDGLNGTIPLEQTIYVNSFKTVDARGHQITLQGVRDESADEPSEGWHNTGISLGRQNDQRREVHDVVFLNLTFDGGWPDPHQDGEGSDGIHLHNRVYNVWVHQCTFHNWIDGAIDARNDDDFDEMPYDITITNSHFHDINQGLLLEAQGVTFARNVCDRVNVRCVKTVDGGKAHVINNVIRNWRGVEIVYAKNDSQVLVDHNIFRAGGDSRLAGRTSGGGRLQDVHNIAYPVQSYRMGDRNSVDPDFKREAQLVYGDDRKVDCENDPPDEGCWNRLYDAVVDGAGADLGN